MISALAVLSLLKKFWVPIACIAGLVVVVGASYYKGKKDCESKLDRAVIEELLRQEEGIGNVNREGRKLRDKTNSDLTDEQASCILSNNPFKKECL